MRSEGRVFLARLMEATRLMRAAERVAFRIENTPPTQVDEREDAEKAFQKYLQDAYSELEQGFRILLDLTGEGSPTGPAWHDIIADMVLLGSDDRPPFLAAHDDAVHILRRFRHVAVHGYSRFDFAQAAAARQAAVRLAAALVPEGEDLVGRLEARPEAHERPSP